MITQLYITTALCGKNVFFFKSPWVEKFILLEMCICIFPGYFGLYTMNANDRFISSPCMFLSFPFIFPTQPHEHRGETFIIFVNMSRLKSHVLFQGGRCFRFTRSGCHFLFFCFFFESIDQFLCTVCLQHICPFLSQTCIHCRYACESMQAATEP